MAKVAITDCHVTIGSDVSGDGADVSIDIGVDAPDASTFSTGGWRSFLPGLKQWSGSVTVMNDFAASGVDSVVWALLGATATFAWRVDSAIVGASNPEFGGTIIITGYQPVGQGIGDVAAGSISFVGSGAITRSTS